MKKRVLVVDDHRDIADSLARLITCLGYEAKAIYDGRQALDAATEFGAEVAFIDIGMPGFDGYELAGRFRGRPECANVALIALTGWAQSEDKKRAYESGFNVHIAKPIGIDTLKVLLAQFVPAARQTALLNCLDEAISITGADFGNVQIVDSEGALRIEVQRGFGEPFLRFFECVQRHEWACGAALERRERTIIPDVCASDLFRDSSALDVMLTAGALAVQSTPLICPAGRVVGILSTHFKRPQRPTDAALKKLDALAIKATNLVCEKRAEFARPN